MARGAGTVGGISVNVTANTAKFGKNITAARKMLGKFGSSIKSTIFSMKGLAAAAAGGLLAKFTTDQAAVIDKLLDMSSQLGITTEALAGLRLAAEENGSSMVELEDGLEKMVMTIGRAGLGNAKAAASFERIGLSVEELKALSPDQQFIAIAGAVSQLKSRTDQLNATYDIFGRTAGSLVNVLRTGKEGMLEAKDAASKLGLAISEESAEGVGRAIDAFNRMKMVVSSIFSNLALELAPFMELMLTGFNEFMMKGEGVKGLAKSLAQGAIEALLMLADIGQQAYGHILTTFADIRRFIYDLSKTWVGSQMGMREQTTTERLMIGSARLEAETMMRSPVSEKIRAKVQEQQLDILESIDGRLKTSTTLAAASIN